MRGRNSAKRDEKGKRGTGREGKGWGTCTCPT